MRGLRWLLLWSHHLLFAGQPCKTTATQRPPPHQCPWWHERVPLSSYQVHAHTDKCIVNGADFFTFDAKYYNIHAQRLLHRAHALHGLGSIIREFRVTCVDVVTCGTWNSRACGRGVISAVVICYTMLSVTGQLVPLVVNHMYRTARMAQFRTNVPKSAIYVRTDRRSASVHPQRQRRSGKRTFPPNGGVGVVRVSGANYRGSWTVQHCHKLRT